MKIKIYQTDVTPLINHAWKHSFGNIVTNEINCQAHMVPTGLCLAEKQQRSPKNKNKVSTG